jgi:hypothetical protein
MRQEAMRSLVTSDGRIWKRLTRPQRKLVTFILENPSVAGGSISGICEGAGVNRKIYYSLIGDERMGSLLPEVLDYILSSELLPVVKVIIQKAKAGSAKHGEMFLKICGLLKMDGTQILQVFQGGSLEPKLMSEIEVNKLLGI